jgi:hypothetical protein
LSAEFSEVRAAFIIRAMTLIMEAARTSETSVDNYFTRQFIPEDKSELHDTASSLCSVLHFTTIMVVPEAPCSQLALLQSCEL